MIFGTRDDVDVAGSYVLPAEDGNYQCPPAKCIWAFWAYRRDENNQVIVDDNNMVLKYNVVDPATMNVIEPEVKTVTANMVAKWISTRLHPGFIGGR
jgi:hypothetical protein